VWTSSRGLKSNGFRVHTEGAGEGYVAIKILSPGGVPVSTDAKKINDFTTEYTYTPVKEGCHIGMITIANQEVPRSPFEINVTPRKKSKLKVFCPASAWAWSTCRPSSRWTPAARPELWASASRTPRRPRSRATTTATTAAMDRPT
jgi:hypothetical protein